MRKSTTFQIPTMQPSNFSWDIFTSMRIPSMPSHVSLNFTPIIRVVQNEAVNQMSVYNLSIVFGPTLFGQPYPGQNGMQTNGAPVMADAGHQNKVSMGLVQCRNAWKTKILLRRPSRRSSNTTQTFLSTKVKKPEFSLATIAIAPMLPYLLI